MPTLSVAMIVKNEAQDLAACLETVKGWVNEIVILDSGSTDETLQIAERFDAKVYINTDWQGFGKQRQLAQQYVTSDYVLWLDADERVTPELQASILQAVENNEQYGDELVHEKVHYPKNAQVKKLKGDLLHFTYKDIHHYLVKSASYAKAWAIQRANAGKKASLMDGVTHALSCFVKMYLLKAGFLDGKQGFLLAILSAHSTFVKYADLWNRTRNND